MKRQSLLFVLREAPFRGTRANACIDLLLTAATFDQQVTLACVGDGVYHLLDEQNGDAIGLKTLSQVFPALELYDVRAVLAEDAALEQRNIRREDLVMPVEGVDREALSSLMENADRVFMF